MDKLELNLDKFYEIPLEIIDRIINVAKICELRVHYCQIQET